MTRFLSALRETYVWLQCTNQQLSPLCAGAGLVKHSAWGARHFYLHCTGMQGNIPGVIPWVRLHALGQAHFSRC